MEIYLLRHGIAENAQAGMQDADRALTAEGRDKLEAVLRRARKAEVQPPLVLTSPLRRAVETAQLACRMLNDRAELVESKALEPESAPHAVWTEIRAHRHAGQLLLVGHEPLFSQLAAYLLGVPSLMVDFKKGALLRVDVDRFPTHPQGILRWFLTAKLASG